MRNIRSKRQHTESMYSRFALIFRHCYNSAFRQICQDSRLLVDFLAKIKRVTAYRFVSLLNNFRHFVRSRIHFVSLSLRSTSFALLRSTSFVLTHSLRFTSYRFTRFTRSSSLVHSFTRSCLKYEKEHLQRRCSFSCSIVSLHSLIVCCYESFCSS